MKKSSVVNLVLVAGLIASCQPNRPNYKDSRLYMRGDTISRYTHTPHVFPGGYWMMHPYGYYGSRGFVRTGYSSPSMGGRASSAHVSRGGFGHSGAHAAS